MLTYFCNTYKRNHAPSVQLCEFVRLKSENFATYDFLILTFISLCLIGLFVKYVRDLLPQWDGKIFSAIGGIYTAAMPLLLTIFGALSIYSVFAYLAEFYIGFVGEFISTDAATWGQAGDFFGGMLNPFLGFCSFMALLYTIRIQSEELRLTRQELARTSQANEKLSQANESQLLLSKLQNFEQLFFKALEQFKKDLDFFMGCNFKVKYYYPNQEKRMAITEDLHVKYRDISANAPAEVHMNFWSFLELLKNKNGTVECHNYDHFAHREALICYGDNSPSIMDKYVFCDTHNCAALEKLILDNYALFKNLAYSLKYSLHAIYQLRSLAAEGKDFSEFYSAQFKRNINPDLLIFLCVICSHNQLIPHDVLSEFKFFEDLTFDEEGYVSGGLINIKHFKLPHASFGDSQSYLAFKARNDDLAKAQETA